MTFEEVIETITTSEPDEWWSEACWGANSGPSYHYQPEFWELIDGDTNVLKVNAHSNVAAYKLDVSITMAWGLKLLDNFKEEWANKFPDPSASSRYLDIFYNNALIFREVYVTVDCGRAKLPLPDRKWDEKKEKIVALNVPTRRCRLIKLVDSLEYISQFDDYFKRAGFTVVDEDWPSRR
jgi:hypothetical protein